MYSIGFVFIAFSSSGMLFGSSRVVLNVVIIVAALCTSYVNSPFSMCIVSFNGFLMYRSSYRAAL